MSKEVIEEKTTLKDNKTEEKKEKTEKELKIEVSIKKVSSQELLISPKSQKERKKVPTLTFPGSFEPENHFYPKAVNANISYVVSNFLELGNIRIAQRYCHLNPNVDEKKLLELLEYKPQFFKWSGADLFNVVSSSGKRQMVLIETNSCPSGMKSMPLIVEKDEQGGYKYVFFILIFRNMMEFTFKPLVEEQEKLGKLPKGGLAVIYDKNYMEASGYASTMADVFDEKVYLVEFYSGDKDTCVRFNKERVLEICISKDENQEDWIPIRAAFRYVTQKPWNRIPLTGTKTLIFNPTIACVAGGRNKLLASKAYDFFNAEMTQYGLQLHTPKTVHDVEKPLVPLWVQTMGGFAVIKNPYSNAGQGVWTITSKDELDEFMKIKYDYEQLIVQSLIGNHKWSSTTQTGQYYHVGTVPDKKNQIFVADLRMMIHYNYKTKGFAPIALYARRAFSPLEKTAPKNSWDVLGTNLSFKKEDGQWDTDTKRLIICAQSSFNKLGIGLDDLINAYIQTIMATVAIDRLAGTLLKEDGSFDSQIFQSLNKDANLFKEILM